MTVIRISWQKDTEITFQPIQYISKICFQSLYIFSFTVTTLHFQFSSHCLTLANIIHEDTLHPFIRTLSTFGHPHTHKISTTNIRRIIHRPSVEIKFRRTESQGVQGRNDRNDLERFNWPSTMPDSRHSLARGNSSGVATVIPRFFECFIRAATASKRR